MIFPKKFKFVIKITSIKLCVTKATYFTFKQSKIKKEFQKTSKKLEFS